MSGGRSATGGGTSLAGLGGRVTGLGRLGVFCLGKIGVRLLADATAVELAGFAGFVFFLGDLGARFTRSLSALATALASLRMRLASFLACLNAFRASFNLALACRASLRAASACFSAWDALVARAAALSFVVLRLLLELLVFIVVLRTDQTGIGESKYRPRPRIL